MIMPHRPLPDAPSRPVASVAAVPHHPPAANDSEALRARKDTVLLAVLPNVVFDGWSPATIRQGGELAGCDAAGMAQLFPDPVADMVVHFSAWADQVMLENMAATAELDLGARARIGASLRARFTALGPYREAVRRTLPYLALSHTAGLGTKLAWDTADRLWTALSETPEDSTSFSYYSKRTTLAAVQCATLLYWLEDGSEHQSETTAFLERRLGDVLRVGRFLDQWHNVTHALDLLPTPSRFARQLRRRLDEVR